MKDHEAEALQGKREMFAALMMQAIVPRGEIHTIATSVDRYADCAVLMADALIARLDKGFK